MDFFEVAIITEELDETLQNAVNLNSQLEVATDAAEAMNEQAEDLENVAQIAAQQQIGEGVNKRIRQFKVLYNRIAK